MIRDSNPSKINKGPPQRLSRNFRIILVETVNQNVKRELEQRQVQPDTDVLSFPRFPIWICSAMVSFNLPKLSQPLSKPYLTSSSYSFVTPHRAPHPTEKSHLVQYLAPCPPLPFPSRNHHPLTLLHPPPPSQTHTAELLKLSYSLSCIPHHPHPLTTTTHPFSLLPLPLSSPLIPLNPVPQHRFHTSSPLPRIL